MDDNSAVAKIGEDYREVRRVRLDQLIEKTKHLENWYDDMEKEAQATFLKQLEVLETGTTPEHERLYVAVSDRMAESLASIRAARENTRAAMAHMLSALHYGRPANTIRHEAIDDESKEF